ncbi:MAG: hypothetical protein JNL19_09720 [Burkholderiales bacterium]|nr:hypothetical protein [Burkholderiales bacterium]
MSSWPGWQPLGDGWVADALALAYAACCIALALCHGVDRAATWIRSRLPQRLLPTSADDPLCDAWRDLALGLFLGAALAWANAEYVAALAMAALGLFCSVLASRPRK